MKEKIKNFMFYLLIIYSILVVGLVIFNMFVMADYIHFMYYYNFILVGHLILNIYSLLYFSK